MIVESYGFVEAGEWHPYESGKSKIEATLSSRFVNERVVYAFVVDNKVEYIGVCDKPKTTLKKRMGTQRYNRIMPRLIREALKANKAVKILAIAPEEFDYKGLKVDLMRALEDALIKQLKPKWNDEIRKYGRQKQQDEKG